MPRRALRSTPTLASCPACRREPSTGRARSCSAPRLLDIDGFLGARPRVSPKGDRDGAVLEATAPSSAWLSGFRGAGGETRTRDSLLGRRFALYAVAQRSILAYSCGFLL